MTSRRQVFSAALVVLIVAIFAGLVVVSNLDACNGGKCTDPLPTQAVTRACDGPGRGPQHKCNASSEEPTATPVPPTPVPPTSEPPATAEPPSSTQEAPASTEPASPPITVTVTVTATEPASLPASDEPACELGSGQDCDPCAVIRLALEQGKVVMIADWDHMSVLADGVVLYVGGSVDEAQVTETVGAATLR